MAKASNKLTAMAAKNLAVPGLYSDGGGLYLQISNTGSKSWIFKFKTGGASWAREMGLGSFRDVPLAEARQRAAEARRSVLTGKDPITERESAGAALRIAKAGQVTFGDASAEYIKSHRAGWKNAKHAQQWENTLATYCADFNALPVSEVRTEHVLKALGPIWAGKTETASRVRNRVELVLDYARALGMRSGENPARWRGHLDKTLPAPRRVKKVAHHASLPYSEAPVFVQTLGLHESPSALAFAFVIFTATRTGEVLGAKWSEIDRLARTWTIPAERMKAGKEHVVPLSDAGLAVLDRAERIRSGDFIFPGRRPREPLSTMTLAMMLRRMKREDITVHGFRSTFRDWAAECTEFPGEVCEMALAHAIGSQTEAAYRRGNLLDKRRALMQAWADHICRGGAAAVDPGNTAQAA